MESMEQIRVVVSGFEHYEGIDVNPSREVAIDLERDGVVAAADRANIDVTAAIIPMSFQNGWPKLRETLERVQPHIVIATGLKTQLRGISLERCANNFIDAPRPDADNMQPRKEPIIKGAPEAFWTELPLHSILASFAHDDIPAQLSSDAGTFVCNSLFYNILYWSDHHPGIVGGFVSFPQVNDDHSAGRRGMSLDKMITASRDVVTTTAVYYRKPLAANVLSI